MSSEVGADAYKQSLMEGICGALSGTATQSRTAMRLESNRSSNVLMAVILNGFVRRSQDKPLSDLEGKLVDAFVRAGFSDQDLDTMGQAFASAAPEVRQRLFTERFARMGAEDSYSLSDLQADLPQLGREAIASAGNLWAMDATRPVMPPDTVGDAQATGPEGEAMLALQPDERYLQATQERGWGLMCMGLPADHVGVAAASTHSTGSYWVSADYVKCHKESNEVGKDEPRFSMALCDSRSQRDFVSEEFSMGTGSVRKFRANRVWDTTVQNGGLTIVVDAWEMDPGPGFEKAKIIIEAILDILMKELVPETWADLVTWTATGLAGVGLPAEVIGLLYAVLTVVKEFLQNNDDHIGTYAVLIPETVVALQKQIQDAMRTPPPEGTAAKIAALTGRSLPEVAIGLAFGSYYCQRPTLTFNAGSDGKWELGFVALPDASDEMTSMPGSVRIDSRHSGKTASVEGPRDADGSTIHQWPWKNLDAQKWRLERLDNANYKIVSQYSPSGRCMTFQGPQPYNKQIVHLWEWKNANHQKWRFLPVGVNEYLIVSHHHHAGISVADPTDDDGSDLLQFCLRATPNMVWKITAV
ncbi:RICIN domain-containing protein [Streptomyces sp. NPDC054901]